MSTLYRDYRPQKFSEVLGQNHIKITLQNEIVAGRPAGAYLFCGPRAVGKTTLARILAKAVNCLDRSDGEFEPCNKCASCLSITGGQNLDVVEIDAASNTGVDNVRDNIIAFSRLVPTSAKYKVFIIDEVHMLSISAFNALLKIIEEPPAYVIFILCTTEVQKVPATIVSRCERYDFKRISVKEVVKKLAHIASQEKVTVAPEILEAVARNSGGHLRDAESLLGQIFSLGDKKITAEQAELIMPHYNSNEAVSLLECLARKDAVKGLALINNLVDSGVNIKAFLGELVGWLRQLMLSKLSPELTDSLGLEAGESLEKRLAQLVDSLSWEQIFEFTRRLLEVTAAPAAAITQLPLELAVAELCLGPARPAPVTAMEPPVSPRRSTSSSSSSPSSPRRPLSGAGPSQSGQAPAGGSARTPGLNFSAAEVLARWPEFLVKIKKHNHSLSFVLQNCEPQAVSDGELSLVFKYKFHQDRVNDPAIRRIVEDALSEVFGRPLTFTSAVVEAASDQAAEDNLSSPLPAQSVKPAAKPEEPVAGGSVMDDLLKTFGGQIVN